MATKTGEGSDTYFFDPHSVVDLRWIDDGGIDILSLHNDEWAGFDIFKTRKAIKVKLDGSTLTIPHDENGTPSIEIVEWRVPLGAQLVNTPAHGASQVLLRLGVVTDPKKLFGAGQLFIGDQSDQTITAPSSGKTASGSFTDIFAAGGDDVVTLSKTYETRVSGGAGDDVIRAQGKPDTVQYGNLGHDKLYGAAGQDILKGGYGHDTVEGGLDNDMLHGGNGNDTLKGDQGNDKLFGGRHADKLFGGFGNDTLNGGLGRDNLVGGGGNDTLLGDGWTFGAMPGGADRIYGGAGNDYINGGMGRDIMFGGTGADTFEWDIGHRGDGDVIKDFKATEDKLILDTHTFAGSLKARIESGDTIVSYGGIDFVRLEDVTLTLSQIDIELL